MLWLTVPVIVLIGLRLADVKTFTPRYLSTLMPLVIFASALGATRLPRRVGLVLGGIWLAMTVWSTGNYHLDPRYARDDIRAAAAWIAERGASDEPVLVPVVTGVFLHYYRGEGEVKDFWDCARVSDAETARRELSTRIGDAPGAWLVLSRSASMDPGHHLDHAFSERGDCETHRFPGVEVVHLRVRTDAAVSEEGAP